MLAVLKRICANQIIWPEFMASILHNVSIQNQATISLMHGLGEENSCHAPLYKSECHWEENHHLGAGIKSDRQYALATVCTSFIAHYRFYTVLISLHAINGTQGNATIYFEVCFNLWQSRSWRMRCEMFRQWWLVGLDLTGLRKYWINDATF